MTEAVGVRLGVWGSQRFETSHYPLKPKNPMGMMGNAFTHNPKRTSVPLLGACEGCDPTRSLADSVSQSSSP